MKLNNIGFAITSILYSLLILFVILVGSYLMILSSKKNRLDIISEDIENNFSFNNCVYKDNSDNCMEVSISFSSLIPYKLNYTGKYIFIINGRRCFSYLHDGSIINDMTSFKCYDTNMNIVSGTNIILKQIYY